MLTLVTLLVVSGALAALGWYGWRHTPELVPPGLDEDTRWRKERTLRRGSASCLAVSVLLPMLLAAAVLQR